MRRTTLAALAPLPLLLLAGCGSSQNSSTAAGSTATHVTAAASSAAEASPSSSPAGLTCADIGGVFVPHGTDGRGDCEPATTSPSCHDDSKIATDGNYIDAMTMTPPFANGTIDNPEVLQGISDPQCWKVPSTG